jgi:hypothetical protein
MEIDMQEGDRIWKEQQDMVVMWCILRHMPTDRGNITISVMLRHFE